MPIRIDSDVNRFKDILKGRVKRDLKKFVSSGNILGQQGKKVVKIPIHTIDLPRFRFGSKGMGGVSQGEGDIGDGLGQGQGKKPGQGDKAGDETGEHDLNAEFSPEELAAIIKEELELPDLCDKGKGKVHAEKNKYNKIGHNGSESLRHNKRTFKEAMKRQISSGSYDPFDPKIIPIKSDKRYRTSSTIEEPDVNTCVIYCIDCSGSMGKEQKHIAEAEAYWIDLLLSTQYKGIESRFIVHDTEAKEVSREDFFKISSAGGTRISSAYNLCAEMIEKEYPFSEWNNYVFHWSDSDNYDSKDSEKAIDIIQNRIVPNSNMLGYGHVKPESSDFLEYIMAEQARNDKVIVSLVPNEDAILDSIKKFFERGK